VKLETHSIEAGTLVLALQQCAHVRDGAPALLSFVVHEQIPRAHVACSRLSCMAEVAFVARATVNESRLAGRDRPLTTLLEELLEEDS
jgi:hypothetical protein